ncbi:hypothetical protein D3C72_1993900 [compost metagenome]
MALASASSAVRSSTRRLTRRRSSATSWICSVSSAATLSNSRAKQPMGWRTRAPMSMTVLTRVSAGWRSLRAKERPEALIKEAAPSSTVRAAVRARHQKPR